MPEPAALALDEDDVSAHPLLVRPGFLVRRLHQIHLALFAAECEGFGTTPVQYTVLTALAHAPPMEQARLAERVGVDRATLADLVGRLVARGLVAKTADPADRRVTLIALAPAGRRLLRRMEDAVERAHARTVEALPEAERSRFLRSLRRLVEANNHLGRAPLRDPGRGRG